MYIYIYMYMQAVLGLLLLALFLGPWVIGWALLALGGYYAWTRREDLQKAWDVGSNTEFHGIMPRNACLNRDPSKDVVKETHCI